MVVVVCVAVVVVVADIGGAILFGLDKWGHSGQLLEMLLGDHQCMARGRRPLRTLRLIPVPLQQLSTCPIRMKPNYVMPQVPLLAKTSSASLANARLEPSMDPLVPVHAEYPIEGLVAVSALKLTRRDLLDVAHGGHFGHLRDQRVIVVQVLDSVS